MTRNEALYLAAFMEGLGDRLGSDGCNDMILPHTPENVELIKEVYKLDNPDPTDVFPVHERDKLYTNNFSVLYYLQRQFMNEYGITQAELPNING